MSTEHQLGGLSVEDRQLVYARARIGPDAARRIESMVECSPGRQPGKAALNNVVTRLSSWKNSATRVLESHTCELIFAYELELDPSVLGYYVQVPCRNIKRTLPNGRLHVSAACIDFLVFRQDAVELVECKPADRLASVENNNDWHHDGIRWRHVAYETFAREHELQFWVWSPPEQPGVYLQNLEALYAVARGRADALRERIARKVAARVRVRPASINDLEDEFDGFDAKTALWMLATRQAYGPLKSTPIQSPDVFTVCADAGQAALIDQLGLEAVQSIYAQPVLSNPIFLASTTDLAKARTRQDRVLAMRRGDIPWSVRMKRLERDMAGLEAKGGNPLVACLTRYSCSGNRQSRLLPEQELAAEKVISQLWNRGRVKTKKNLYFAYQDECALQGVPAASRTSLYLRVQREKQTSHALATGGLRGYQAVRPATDPSRRSLPPIGFGHTLHIDSSDLDVRIAPDLLKRMPAQKVKFYVGLDGATGLPMAHALIFGPARTDGLAILLREYVRRWGRLPNLIHWDRGPEDRSTWSNRFAEAYQASLRFSPTAGSAWNGLAEATIRCVNKYVSHELIGSTLPDQKGRKVDGRFKSYRNAKTRFEVVRRQFLSYVYEDYPNTPGPDDLTPLERQKNARDFLGEFGFECAYDEDFLLATSVPMRLKRNVNKQRGVRTEDGFFSSDQLLDALRMNDVEEARSDCEDPTILRVRVGGAWIKAFHSRVQSMALLSREDKLFDLMYASIRRAQAYERKENIERARFDRIQRANFATLAGGNDTSKLDSDRADHQPVAQPASANSAALRAQWDELDLLTERGERS